jgi:methyltransferase (TIGR00027 family)
MKVDQPSRTADFSAAARAAHLRYDRPVVFDDPLAIHLTSRGWRWIVKSPVLYRLVARNRRVVPAARGTFVARARYTEDRLGSAILRGTEQYVILGAGLDSFAWRQTDPAQCLRIFEIDHPASQLAKRRRLDAIGLPTPKNLEWVASDLAQESVADALARSSYRREARSFFSLLGTVQYLPRDAVMNTLQSIAIAASPGSELVVSYLQPITMLDAKLRSAVDRYVRSCARKGEPFVSFFDAEEFPVAVCALGYELIENCSPREIELRYFGDRTDELQPGSMWLSHIAHFRVTNLI